MANTQTCSDRTLTGVIRGTNFSVTGIDPNNKGIVQKFSLQFQRSLTRVYDLASPEFFYVEGPSQGTAQFVNIVGPNSVPKMTCDCTPKQIVLDAGNTLCYPANESYDASYTLKNALPAGISGEGNATNFLIVFSVSYMFNDLV